MRYIFYDRSHHFQTINYVVLAYLLVESINFPFHIFKFNIQQSLLYILSMSSKCNISIILFFLMICSIFLSFTILPLKKSNSFDDRVNYFTSYSICVLSFADTSLHFSSLINFFFIMF